VKEILPVFFVLSTSGTNAIIYWITVMAPIIDRFISLFSSPEGNLVYSFVLGIIAFSGLVACLYARGHQQSTESKRMQFGFITLLVLQLLLFGVAWLAWLGVIDGHTYLPPIDRCLALLSLVLIIWLWVFPKNNRFFDALVILVIVAIVFLGGAGVALWLGESANNSFNTSNIGGYAYYSGIGFILVGMILLVSHQSSYWGYGFSMFLVLLAGYMAQIIIQQPAGDYSWFVHLGEMFGFIFLLILPKRLGELQREEEATKKEIQVEKLAFEVDADLIGEIGEVITDNSPQPFYQNITRLLARISKADFCLLFIPPKTGEQLIVPVGYDNTQAKSLEGFTADGHSMQPISEAVNNGKALLLSSDQLKNVIKPLMDELRMDQVKQFMMMPFRPKGTNALMAIALLTNSDERWWTDQDLQRMMSIIETLIASSGKHVKSSGISADQEEVTAKLQIAQAYTDQVRLEYAQLKAKYDSLATQAATAASQTESMALMADNQRLLEDTVKRLEARNRELESLLGKGRPSMEEVEQLRQELRSALADLARIPSTLSKSDQKMLETQLSALKSLDKLQPTELITSIAQDFRQPLSSIVGYTDLLLGESVGLLGAMQRKFLERVKASTERLGMLMNELVQVVTIDGGGVDQTLVSVNLKPMIDDAIGNINAQIKEKNIAIEVNLPEKLPEIRANEDALQQILNNLFENACLASPMDGVIKVLGSVEQVEGEPSYMLISVSDQGGGIDNADLPRVFLRRYKMENPLIQGVGDTGVGLSIVKSLVELLKGRVWVDSEPGVGSSFSVLLPLAEEKSGSSTSNNSTG
jgi:signal transduction histidine kinase